MISETAYVLIFIASLMIATVYVFLWRKRLDITFSMLFTFIPIACMGYAMYAFAENVHEAIAAMKVVYIGGCFLQYFIMMSVFNLCQIRVNRWIRTVLFFICVVLYASVATIGYRDWFYSKISFTTENGYAQLLREYGPMHKVFYVVLGAYFLISIVTIFYAFARRRQVPRLVMYLLLIPDLGCLTCYFLRGAVEGVELLPIGYLMAEIFYLTIGYKVSLYDVSDTAIDSVVQDGDIGFVTFDLRGRYLGSNKAAKEIMPQLHSLTIDRSLDPTQDDLQKLAHMLESFRADEQNNSFVYTVKDPGGDEDKDRIYDVGVKYLYGDERKCGYMIIFQDDTQNRKYMALQDSYNEDLRLEVAKKTQHIVEMRDNLIMSLAMMVESRDNSTGGHIMRTSVGVRILMDVIEEDSAGANLGLTPEMIRDIIKAAPMHDLGKIAVDDAILRKPGRFTPEEFEKMKEHSAKGSRVIHEILSNTDDESFRKIAENVAHYHHERWDGSGYPEGLAGEQIPIEARIMAIADVYDALVSKRVYKDSMSFEKADAIIMEGMGTQFDPGLQKYYEKARPRLEEYYRVKNAEG